MTTSDKLDLISDLVPKIINFSSPKRLRKGVVHDGICRALKIPRSNRNIKYIKMVLAAFGVREVVIRGRSFYSTQAPTPQSPHFENDLSLVQISR